MVEKKRNFTNICSECDTEFAAFKSVDKTCSVECRVARKERITKETGRRKAQNEKFKTSQPSYGRSYRLNRYYGLTLEDYDEMLAKQDGKCAVCQKPAELCHNSLAVDHDHKTGEIFGLLCYRCNHGIVGNVRDPEIFKRASEYLSEGTGRFVPEQFIKGKGRKRKKKRASK